MTKCFLVAKTDRAAVYLRRYTGTKPCPLCPGQYSYHDGSVYLQDADILVDAEGYWGVPELGIPHDDPRWPRQCACGYVFENKDAWQGFTDRLYVDSAGKTYRHRELPVGAMYYADWLPRTMYWDNLTADPLYVVTPGGEWDTDSRASNCTLPNDRLHRCWCKHGTPPDIHVDKVGLTCAAGAGSIMCGNYHGFLHNGSLT